jgi:AcrR family transcriptional regulator
VSELPPHLQRGQQTRDNLMEHAVQIATREGLEALTIGRVAEAAGIAKASVLGHYRSKEQLQLATLEAGSRQFIASVIAPASVLPEGILRLQALLERWIEQISAVQGGCLFASVTAEFDGRPGAVREHVQKLVKVWLSVLSAQVVQAKQLKHLSEKTDSEQLVFCLHGIELSLNVRLQLFEDRGAIARARVAMHALLREGATALGRKLLSSAPSA